VADIDLRLMTVVVALTGGSAVALFTYAGFRLFNRGWQGYEERYIHGAVRTLDDMYLTIPVSHLVYLSIFCAGLLGAVFGFLLMSIPVAVFAGLSYLVIGMAADMAMADVDPEMKFLSPPSVQRRISHGLAGSLRLVVASPQDFSVAKNLSRGHLISFARVGWVFGTVVVVQGGILLGLGTLVFRRRELGKVVRR
jgi:hypothetical protein